MVEIRDSAGISQGKPQPHQDSLRRSGQDRWARSRRDWIDVPKTKNEDPISESNLSTISTTGALLPTLALLLVSLIWGTTFVAVKTALEDVPPFLFLSLRFGIGAIASSVLIRKSPGLRSALLAGIPLGVVLAGGFGAQTLGLVTTTPARSGFLTGLNVLLIPIWGLWILGKRPGWVPLFGLGVATVGMWFLTQPGSSGWVSGDGWTLACAVFFGLHVVLLTRFGTSGQSGGFLFSQLATTSVLGAIAHFAWDPDHPVRWGSEALWGALLLTGVFASLLTTWLQMKFQPRVSPVRVALVFAMEPVFAAIFSVLFWHENLGTTGWLGGGLILSGMFLAELHSIQFRKTRVEPPVNR